MHLLNFYPQSGSVDPWWCYWSCITSSCTCHPTKIAPSMFCHDVAASLAPFNGFQMPPPTLFFPGKCFPWQALHVLSFWHKNSSEADILSKFPSFPSKSTLFYAVMAQASANVYRVNKLLEIEAVDWQQQLERAVGGSFSPWLARSSFPFSILIFSF